MNSSELKPTEENLFSAYKNDLIGRNEHLFRFVELLDSFDMECTIAVDGRWGSGKTFFVKQAKMILDAFNSFTDENGFAKVKADEIKSLWAGYKGADKELSQQVTVYYDAWANDGDDDPAANLESTGDITNEEVAHESHAAASKEEDDIPALDIPEQFFNKE